MADASATVVDLLPWDLTLRRADSRARAAQLFDAKDFPEAVAALSEMEAYHTVKALGADAASPLLAALTPAQTRALVDLDTWHAGELGLSDLLTWLDAFREAGLGAVQRAARALDPEALATLFRRRLLITLVPKDDASDQDPLPEWAIEPPDDIQPLVKTADGRFIVGARAVDEEDEEEDPERAALDEEERKAALRLVDDLYRDEDWEFAAGLLRLAMTDLSSTLHEDARRLQQARLEDLGFPPLERALEVYGLQDPGVLQAPATTIYPLLPAALPAPYVAPLAQGLFHEAMRRIEDLEVVRRIEGDLVPLANAALVADGAAPGQLERLQDSLTRARGYLELALAHDTAPGAERLETAQARLRVHHVGTLFRVGYTLTVRAAERGRRLVREGALDGALPLSLLEDAERSVLDGLRRRRPQVSAALEPAIAARREGAPAPDLVGAGEIAPRPFRAPEDLDALCDVLADLEGLAAASPRLRAGLEAEAVVPPEERTATVLVATAAARALLGGAPELAPLTAEALADLADRLGAAGGPDFGAEAVAAAGSAVVAAWGLEGAAADAVRGRARRGLAALAEALWPLVGAEVDPRFVTAALTRLTPT